MATVHETYEFDAPVERTYAWFSEHSNLKTLFGIDVERIKEGDTDPNGVGSVRKLSLKGIMPFEETVTEAIPNERIEYRVTKGTPLRNHLGVMVFSTTGDGRSHVDYTITSTRRSLDSTRPWPRGSADPSAAASPRLPARSEPWLPGG